VVSTAVMVERASRALAERINRRSFIRKGADVVFGVGIVVGGGSGHRRKHHHIPRYTSECGSAGPGCPYGCGPSQCCNRHGRPRGCNCGTGTNCSHTGNCNGKAGTWGGASCWTCQYYECRKQGKVLFTTTCCDCSSGGCDADGRCISYAATSQVVGHCGGRPATMPIGSVLAEDTGDPAASRGDVSIFFNKEVRPR
jgi:hypothetical protein